MIPSVQLDASFKLRLLHSSHKLTAMQIFYLNIMIFLENHPLKIIFHIVSLSNLENILPLAETKTFLFMKGWTTSFSGTFYILLGQKVL